MNEQPKTPLAKIIRSFLCERCGYETKNHSEYLQHRIDHTNGNIKAIHPVTGEAYVTGGEDKKPLAQPPITTQVTSNAPQPMPVRTQWPQKGESITLKYLYTGTCPTCSTVIETIPLDIEVEKQKKFIVIAWCPNEKKNIQQRMVTKL